MKSDFRVLITVTAAILAMPVVSRAQDAASRPIEVPTPTATATPKPTRTPKPTPTPKAKETESTPSPAASVATTPEPTATPAETATPEKKAEPVERSEEPSAAAVEQKRNHRSKKQSASQPDERARYDRAAASALKSLEKQWEANFTDTAVVDKMLADDFVGTSPDGKLMSKRALLREAREGGAVPKTTAHNLDVHFYGENVAVVTGRTKQLYRDRAGRVVGREYRFTDTWVHRAGRWRCVASQSTLLPSR